LICLKVLYDKVTLNKTNAALVCFSNIFAQVEDFHSSKNRIEIQSFSCSYFCYTENNLVFNLIFAQMKNILLWRKWDGLLLNACLCHFFTQE